MLEMLAEGRGPGGQGGGREDRKKEKGGQEEGRVDRKGAGRTGQMMGGQEGGRGRGRCNGNN